MPDRLEIYVVDDDEAVRKSLNFMLRAAGFLVRTYDSAADFLADAKDLGPGCLLTDVRMPDMDGLELLRRMKAQGLAFPVVVMTGHGDVPLAVEAMKLGAADFIEKPFSDEVLLAALGAARRGVSLNGEADAQPYKDLVAKLTPREVEVLKSVVAGHTNKVIGRQFGISPRTVEVHRANLMLKLNVTTLSELVRTALLAGL
ncbi:MAG: response regulator [Phenylobacterium sp.]|uniref:response regulator FixJ n=1 Tax=Phenylobacterium sp. TaxID=1871053 RepID=UPI001A563273|nr:response regulator FixJ [Phenylobacterium sp.]MBL8774002.1 response regulator [Phenylobacterium sp.]